MPKPNALLSHSSLVPVSNVLGHFLSVQTDSALIFLH